MMQEEAGHELATEYIPTELPEFLEHHQETIRTISERRFNRQGFTSPDDIEQAIREHVIRKWKNIVGADAAQAGRVFGKAANQYLAKEAMDYQYFTGTFIYTPALVRSLLESSAWSLIEEAPDLEGRVDVLAAYKNLPPAQKRGVFRRFGLKVPPGEDTDTQRRNTNYGVDSICNYLNRMGGKARTYSMDELRHKLASNQA